DGGAHTKAMADRAARAIIIDRAVRLLSGPQGLAGWLRFQLTSGPAASVSLPLDVGTAIETIPAHIRRAVAHRDQHCRFPGCTQRPAACQVHHLIPRSEGGPTSLDNCILLCAFHHLIAIHRWQWELTLNPDGTTTARDPAGIRTLHSHAPPVEAA
ncbi:MAG TPA: HNH endonuclease signature motif containing protein, partial [Streptosporangiaceae bacterium]|nr:HNH endonuclease signature motif containing protein [Streptosporangiaceae bacterium]